MDYLDVVKNIQPPVWTRIEDGEDSLFILYSPQDSKEAMEFLGSRLPSDLLYPFMSFINGDVIFLCVDGFIAIVDHDDFCVYRTSMDAARVCEMVRCREPNLEEIINDCIVEDE